jgi:glutamyl-tRNA reductase
MLPMAELWVVGWDHHCSPVELRERMVVTASDQERLLQALCAVEPVSEAVLLSTCNRTECYLAGEAAAEQAALHLLAAEMGVPDDELRTHAFVYHDAAAVRHLFRVIGSLESMVLGEYQIQHQVKQAFEAAQAAQAAGKRLSALFQRALAVGKQIRNRTGIGEHKTSIASVAVDLAQHIHGDLRRKRLLVCGAGEMAELAVTHLLEHGVHQVAVVNRSRERAETLAQVHEHPDIALTVHDWLEFEHLIPANDIIISSTAAPHAVLTTELLARVSCKRREPLMVIDLAVPRDVEASAGELDNVYLYNIDHLDSIVADYRDRRAAEVGAAEEVIEECTAYFLRQSNRQSNELLAAVARAFVGEVEVEHQRLCKRLGLDEVHAKEARQALDRLAGKLRHRLLTLCKDHPEDPEVAGLVMELIRESDR